jgi:ribosomal protein L37E
MGEITAEAWQKEIEDARDSPRKRFPDLCCLRCGRDSFLVRMWPDESLAPGVASADDNRVVELVCENCGFQEKHFVRLLSAETAT